MSIVTKAHLWMANVEANVTDQEIQLFMTKYGFPPVNRFLRVEGSGSQPGVLLTFLVHPEALRRLQPRIQHMFWKCRTIDVQVLGGNFDAPVPSLPMPVPTIH
jgi:hypothetical protein